MIAFHCRLRHVLKPPRKQAHQSDRRRSVAKQAFCDTVTRQQLLALPGHGEETADRAASIHADSSSGSAEVYRSGSGDWSRNM